MASLLSARVAAAAGAAAIAVFGGGIAAAYTGSLPAGLQKFAHAAFAAPNAHDSTAWPTPESAGHQLVPSVRGSAAYGLCNAYQHANASQRATAFRNLVNAAGGAGQVAAYCASVPHPGNPGTGSPPGRRVGQTASPADTNHGRKPTAPPGKPTTTPGNGNGNGNGNGGGNGGGSGHGNQ